MMRTWLVLSLVGVSLALIALVGVAVSLALSARYATMTIVGATREPAAQTVLFGSEKGGRVFWVAPDGVRRYLPRRYHVPAHLGADVIGRITVSGELHYATVEPSGVWQMTRDDRTGTLIVSVQRREGGPARLAATFEPVGARRERGGGV